MSMSCSISMLNTKWINDSVISGFEHSQANAH